MCRNCYSDPAWDKIHYQRQGMVEASDFDDEPRYRHPKRRAKKPRARSLTRSTPCPETEDGKHVYVWAPYLSDYSPRDKVFQDYFGYPKREIQTCCGCLATKGYGRETERYEKVKEAKWRKRTGGEFGVKRGEPISRRRRWGTRFYSFCWEDYHDGYQKFVSEWEQSKEAKRLEQEAIYRRIKMRMKLLGYSE